MSLFPIISPVASVPAEVALTASSLVASGSNPYTFSGVALGAVATDRKMVVSTCCPANAAYATGMTIAGVTATLVVEYHSGSDVVSMWQADVASGTTGDIVVTVSGGVAYYGIGVWRVIAAGTGPTAADDTDTDSTNSAPMPMSIDCPAGGIIIAACMHYAGTSIAWTNITERYDDALNTTQLQSGASDAFAAEQTGLVITATPNASSVEQAAVCASWGPA